MKRLIIVLLLTFFAPLALAQQVKEPDYNTVREFRNKVFSLQHRGARVIASAIELLGSGFKGAGLDVNEELRTITVRDFPENIAAMDEAVKRLDKPVPQSPDVELRVHVLLGSKSAMAGSSIPDELAPVVTQLRSTLSYTHYGLMTTFVHRTKPGVGIEGSGVAEATLLGMTASQERPLVYSYRLRGISFGSSTESPTVEIGNVAFSMRIPLDLGSGNYHYQSLGFETPVTLRQREKVVIGTTSMLDKALIIVVTANVMN
ncbi:MAG TPA: hypothetical protein VNA04_14900 [Thermoanaerobaculia bacterium]|nr:hypothetical protein [Thermoanaerobaculia bacterium]